MDEDHFIPLASIWREILHVNYDGYPDVVYNMFEKNDNNEKENKKMKAEWTRKLIDAWDLSGKEQLPAIKDDEVRAYQINKVLEEVKKIEQLAEIGEAVEWAIRNDVKWITTTNQNAVSLYDDELDYLMGEYRSAL